MGAEEPASTTLAEVRRADHGHALRPLPDPDYLLRLEASWVLALPEVAAGRWRPVRLSGWPLKWVRGSRVLAVDLSYRDGAGEGRLALVVKAYSKLAQAEAAQRALAALFESGFRPPAGQLVPRPLALDRAARVLVQERALGQQWIELVLGGEAPRASAAAARWLAALQRCHPPASPVPLEADADRVLRLGRRLRQAFPEAEAMCQLARRVAEEIRRPSMEPVPSHGDFHPKNLLIRGETVVGVDLDGFGLREPAADVGDGIGQLVAMSELRLGSANLGAAAAQLFWAAHRDLSDPRIAPPRIGVFVARTYVQALHYALCYRGGRRTDLLLEWSRQGARWLAGEGEAVLAELAVGAPG